MATGGEFRPDGVRSSRHGPTWDHLRIAEESDIRRVESEPWPWTEGPGAWTPPGNRDVGNQWAPDSYLTAMAESERLGEIPPYHATELQALPLTLDRYAAETLERYAAQAELYAREAASATAQESLAARILDELSEAAGIGTHRMLIDNVEFDRPVAPSAVVIDWQSAYERGHPQEAATRLEEYLRGLGATRRHRDG